MKKAFAIAAISTIFLTSCTSTQKGTKSTSETAVNSGDRLAQGKSIFENSCGRCHDLPNPTDHTSIEWVGIMNSMAPKAKLNDEQHQMVYDYVVSVKK